MSVQSIISLLDIAASDSLPAAKAYGLCELRKGSQGFVPVVSDGDGGTVVATDAPFRYWRLRGRITEKRNDETAICGDVFETTIPLRLVVMAERSACENAWDHARAAATSMRLASTQVRAALNAMRVDIDGTSIETDSSAVYRSEFGGTGFGDTYPSLVMVSVDLTVTVLGRAGCLGPCDPVDVTCRVIAAASNAKVSECLGSERINEICEGGGPCPSLCDQLSDPLVDVPAAVDCIPNGNIPEWTQVMLDQDEATPEVIVVGIEGAGKADAVKAILCDPCPECDPLEVLVNGEAYAEVDDPCGGTTAVSVKDADGNGVGSLDGVIWRIPSATVQLQDSAGNPIGSADSYLPGANTTKTAPDGTVQRQDSAGVNIGTPIAVRSNQTGLAVTCPDGTVTINNSVPTLLHSVAVKSNGSAVQAIADSTITKPDGTTVGLPATVALDVRDYRSGIQYQFGDIFWSGQTVEYRTGDEGTLWAAGWFSYTPPVYPLRLARLGADRVTLAENNVHGNTNRFTDRSGGQTYSDDIVQDHLTGIEWYRVLQTAATWNNAIDGALALSVGGNTDWKLPTTKLIDSIANDAAGNASNSLNYAPFNISNSNYWTSSTYGVTTTSAWRMSAQLIVATSKPGTNAWLACRRFI